jgi:ribonuclease HI
MWCNRPNDTMQSATPGRFKPQADWIKCNVNCALFETEGKFGVGICFQNNLGHLIQAHSMVFPSISTAAKGEATALQQALQIALDLGLNRVVFETDCQLVVNVVLSNNTYVNEVRSLLSNCRALFFFSNASYALAYVMRQANRVTHNLARVFILHASPSIFNHPPHCIDSIILDEIK